MTNQIGSNNENTEISNNTGLVALGNGNLMSNLSDCYVEQHNYSLDYSESITKLNGFLQPSIFDQLLTDLVAASESILGYEETDQNTYDELEDLKRELKIDIKNKENFITDDSEIEAINNYYIYSVAIEKELKSIIASSSNIAKRLEKVLRIIDRHIITNVNPQNSLYKCLCGISNSYVRYLNEQCNYNEDKDDFLHTFLTSLYIHCRIGKKVKDDNQAT